MSSRVSQPKAELRAAAEPGFSKKARRAVQQNPGNQLQETANSSAQVQKAAVVQAMANKQFPAAAPAPVQKKANRTGLPENLKSGIENLSGHSLDDVQVHYNSPKPAALQAHAYAQGNQIHLAPGQQKHLPHEAWHVVQQKQGRVPATGKINGQALNDSQGLEQEADVMGNKSLQLKREARGPLLEKSIVYSQAPVQRTPEEVFEKAKEKDPWKKNEQLQELLQQLIQLFENTWQVKKFPAIDIKSLAYKSVRAELHTKTAEFFDQAETEDFDKADWIKLWNKGLDKKKEQRFIEKGVDSKYEQEESQNGFPNEDAGKYIAGWYKDKKLSDKKMVPDKKMANILPYVTSEELPEDVIVALKLFFSHTANFVPVDNIGRDYRGREHGQYYRSSNDKIREGNSEVLKQDAIETRKENGTKKPGRKKSPTYQVLNMALIDEIEKTGNISSSLKELNEFSMESGHSYSEYMSHPGIHTGALGAIQNVYRTVRVGTMLEAPEDKQEENSEHFTKGLDPQVEEELLAPGSDENYHDQMLRDRSTLIREVTATIQEMYPENVKDKIRVVPIQSQDHASLILSLHYPDDVGEEDKLSEKTWRETFIDAFNTAAENVKLDTRITHRGSFGFLYPTASSVGDPVRIWPGMAPAPVFKRLLFNALRQLTKDNSAFHRPFILKGDLESKTNPLLHRETLKTAVKYAQQVMQDTLIVQGPLKLFEWTRMRLKKNLLKAKFILEQKDPEKALENDYLKSTLVIENLMEYSYMLGALNKETTEQEDPYPAYVRQKLTEKSKNTEELHTGTFYLDSGMQSIVVAHLLARNWIIQKKKLDAQAKLKTIDLYSYFEYGMVDSLNLNLEPQNREDDKRTGPKYLSKVQFEREMKKKFPRSELPSIIAADMNPVFTKPELRDQHVPNKEVFKKYEGIKKKNEETIPIVDVTNASLDKVADLDLGAGYENFVIVESLSKHQQLGADKFTMGRLTAAGSKEFVDFAKKLIGPIETKAHDRLPSSYRLQMDKVFYGKASSAKTDYQEQFLKNAGKYDEFMRIMGLEEKWKELMSPKSKEESEKKEYRQQLYFESRSFIQEAFRLYAQHINSRKSGINLEKAFKALPVSDHKQLLGMTARELESEGIPLEFMENDLQNSSQTGITNVGNTCYMAAALNMIAFSHYYDLFNPVLFDPNADLRAAVKAVLDKIRGGTLVPYKDVAFLLRSFSTHKLLEAPIHGQLPRALNAQRDPAEVMEFVLGFFGIDGQNYVLGQTYHTQMNPSESKQVDADHTKYSAVNQQGEFQAQTRADWIIKLPVAQAAHLQTALARYLQTEQLGNIRGSYGNQAMEGPGKRKVSFGDQAPKTIAIQLVRWSFEDGLVKKDKREIEMPDQIKINGAVYQLTAVIYHLGGDAEDGHYTSSTLHKEKGWQYRDDKNVSEDKNFKERKKLGYLYSYTKIRDVTDDDDGMLDLKNPGEVNMHPYHLQTPGYQALALSEKSGQLDLSSQSVLQFLVKQNPVVTIHFGGDMLKGSFNSFMKMMPGHFFQDTDDFYDELEGLFELGKRKRGYSLKEDQENELHPIKKKRFLEIEFDFGSSGLIPFTSSSTGIMPFAPRRFYRVIVRPKSSSRVKKNLLKDKDENMDL